MATRRGNGEGTEIKQRGNKWWTQVRIGDRRVSVTGATKTEVRQKVRLLLQNAEEGILPSRERWTVAEYMECWLEGAVRDRVGSYRTHESYRQLARLYLLPAIGSVKLTELQPEHLEDIYRGMQARGLSASTVHRAHAVIRSMLKLASQRRLVPRNVATLVQLPRSRKQELLTLDEEQVRRLLEAACGTRQEALITLAVMTGLRQGELLALRWMDVDLEAESLHVRFQLDHRGQFAQPKTRAARRTLSLSTPVVEVLRAHRIRQLEDRMRAGEWWQDQDLVFCSHRPWPKPAGAPLQHRNVTRDFKALLAKARLPNIRFHDLRHTAATMMLLHGVNIKVAQARLGHAQINLTLDTYSHVLPAMDRDAAERLATLMA
ncbi:MAG: site-specific integrase [Chloroflexota bacterium]|nr:site-specific integrase [Chloroflexota bacterium]